MIFLRRLVLFTLATLLKRLKLMPVVSGDLLEDLTQLPLLLQVCKCIATGRPARYFDELTCDLGVVLEGVAQLTTNIVVAKDVDLHWNFILR